MPAWCVQLHIYDLFEKAQLKLSPSIENCVQQDYIPELYVRHVPSYQKCPKLLHPPGVDCSPFPWTFMGNPGDREKSYPTTKSLLISPIRKISLNRFKPFAVKSFISSPMKQQFSSNHPMQSSLVAAVISVVSYFKFQALCSHMSC